MTNVLIIIGIILIGILAIIFIPAFLTRRAAKQTIKILRKAHATSPEDAKKTTELGLAPRSFMRQIGRTKDYKPVAVEGLIRAGVIEVTEDSRIYLVEEKLIQTNLK